MVSRILKWIGNHVGDVIFILFAILTLTTIAFCAYSALSWNVADDNAPPNVYGGRNDYATSDGPGIVIVSNREGQVLCSYVIPEKDYRGQQAELNKFDCAGKENVFYGSGK